jgi:hypothetical protein
MTTKLITLTLLFLSTYSQNTVQPGQPGQPAAQPVQPGQPGQPEVQPTFLPAGANVNITTTGNTTFPISNQLPTTNTTLLNNGISTPFNDGDLVYIESTAIGGSYLWSKTEGCRDKKPGETCGDVKAFYGIGDGSRYLIRKSPTNNTYCFAVESLPNVFMYLKDVKNCKSGDNDCGSPNNYVESDCQTENAFNLVPVHDTIDSNYNGLYALQTLSNSRVYLKAKVKECADQIDRNEKPHECGNVNGQYIENPDLLRRGSYVVFRIYKANNRP